MVLNMYRIITVFITPPWLFPEWHKELMTSTKTSSGAIALSAPTKTLPKRAMPEAFGTSRPRIIPNISPLTDINEKNVETQYKELLNTDNHENLVKIIKTTYLRNENRINNKKKISDKDDKYFNLAEKYLYNELSISLNETIENIKEYIFKIVNK